MNKCFFKGVETTIEKVYATSDRAYHIAEKQSNNIPINVAGFK